MGISSTKRGIRTWAATDEYRDNWDRLFGEPKPATVGLCTIGLCCPAPAAIKEWEAKHKEFLKDLILQDIAVAEEVLAELGYKKKKAPTPVKESRPCSHKTCDYEVGGRWSCEYPPI